MYEFKYVLHKRGKVKDTDPCLIQLYTRINGEKLQLSMRMKATPSQWSPSLGRGTGRAKAKTKNHAEINNVLGIREEIYNRVIKEMVEQGVAITKDELKNRLEYEFGWREKSEEAIPKVVKYSMFDYFWFYYDRELRRKDFDTVKVFQYTINKLEEFNSELDWKDINMSLYYEFKDYLESKGLGLNTIGSHLNRIKIMVNRARKEGKTDTHMPDDWKRLSEEPEAIALSDEEVNALYNVKIKNDSYLEKVRDLFVVGCRTGLRSGNYLKINPKEDIQDGMLRVSALKGGGVVPIPLHWQVKEILEKYKYELPSVTSKTLNKRIKELAVGIVKGKLKQQKTVGGRKVEVVIPRHLAISSHTARRSFATQMYNLGFPPKKIMSITGHSSIDEFMKYIRIDREENAKEIGQHPFFSKPKGKVAS